jgi:hypothetical protein
MKYTKEQEENLVQQYANALSSLNIGIITLWIHPRFKYIYHINNGMRNGLTSDLRYIGHMFKTFFEMKPFQQKINVAHCYIERDGILTFSIKLLPPHDRRIIFPLDDQLTENARNPLPDGEVYLLPKIKDNV